MSKLNTTSKEAKFVELTHDELEAVTGGSGKSGGSGPGGAALPKIAKLASLGAGEGSVNIIAWAGYVEDGSNDPKVDWVHDFEKETGCKVNNKIAATSDEMVTLMKTGDYDVVSASGDASLRLIASAKACFVNGSTPAPQMAPSSTALMRLW